MDFKHLQLVLDNDCVAQTRGPVTFHLNRATPHPHNPLLEPGQPHEWDSLQVSWPSTVLYSAKEKKFRCWYSGLDAIQTPDRFWRTGYAESDDGIHWLKPELGQVQSLDRPTNCLSFAWERTILSFVFENPAPHALPSRRFGAYFTEKDPEAPGELGMHALCKGLAYSPDGITWTRHGTAYRPAGQRRTLFQDINQLLFDPTNPDPARRVIGYTQCFAPRSWDGFGVRHIGMVRGPTHEHVEDADPRIVLTPQQGIDEELHFATVNRFDQQYLMLFESDRFSKNPIDGDLRLAVSGDGVNFRRVHLTHALVDTGPKGSWNQNLLVTTCGGMLEVGDEHFIFFHGCPGVYNSWPSQYAVAFERRGGVLYPAYLGLATLPLHRFGFARGPGEIEIDYTVQAGSGLWINADGTVKVTALAADGSAINRGDLDSQRRRSVYRAVRWLDPAPDAARPVSRLRLTLEKDCDVFSVAYN